MKQIVRLGALAAGILIGAAFGVTGNAAQAAVKNNYCRTDTGGMRGCGFETLEQCQAMASGRSGTCSPNPFPDTSDSLASVVMEATRTAKHSRH
jgi:Protein of unknown function (DUF3551)